MSMTFAAALAIAALAVQPASPTPSSPPPQLSQANAALVRCAAAFALVAYGQEQGDEMARKWPAIDPRGREFFVRALAQVMDETGMDREAVAQLAQAEAQRLLEEQRVDQIMPACLLMLDASEQ